MKIIAILLLVFGFLALLISSFMFGDIGVAAAIGAITAILSGIGFLKVNKAIIKMNNLDTKESEL